MNNITTPNSTELQTLIDICQKNDVAKLGVFGSYARGEETSDSDLDLLVWFSKDKSLIDLVRLQREFSEALEIKVDLLTEGAISPYLRDQILSELRILYEEK